MVTRELSRTLLSGFVLAAAVCAQAPVASTPSAPPAGDPVRVYVIGASVSGGFEDGPLTGAPVQCRSVPLQTVLKAWLEPIDGKALSFPYLAMQGLFTDPSGIGEQEVKAAIKSKPDLVLAIDFPFWFGYGGRFASESRLKKLEVGLRLLEQLPGDVILGDFPDMAGAAPRMLPASAIPTSEELKGLNERLSEWVQQHQGKPGQSGPRAHLFPLAQQVKTMKQEGIDLPLAAGAVHCPAGGLLQTDHLHATRLGMAWFGWQLQQFVQQEFAKDSVWRQSQLKFDDFVAATKAEDEVEALRDKAKAAGKPVGAGKQE